MLCLLGGTYFISSRRTSYPNILQVSDHLIKEGRKSEGFGGTLL